MDKVGPTCTNKFVTHQLVCQSWSGNDGSKMNESLQSSSRGASRGWQIWVQEIQRMNETSDCASGVLIWKQMRMVTKRRRRYEATASLLQQKQNQCATAAQSHIDHGQKSFQINSTQNCSHCSIVYELLKNPVAILHGQKSVAMEFWNCSSCPHM